MECDHFVSVMVSGIGIWIEIVIVSVVASTSVVLSGTGIGIEIVSEIWIRIGQIVSVIVSVLEMSVGIVIVIGILICGWH